MLHLATNNVFKYDFLYGYRHRKDIAKARSEYNVLSYETTG